MPAGIYIRTKPVWNKGIKTGLVPKSAFKKGMTSWNKGKKGYKLSAEQKRKISEGVKKHLPSTAYKVKNGNALLQKLIRNTFKYRQWRCDVFERDDYTCQKCGTRGGNKCPHHKKGFSKILKENNIKTVEQALLCEELWNINNGQTLCHKCHKHTDNYGRKEFL